MKKVIAFLLIIMVAMTFSLPGSVYAVPNEGTGSGQDPGGQDPGGGEDPGGGGQDPGGGGQDPGGGGQDSGGSGGQDSGGNSGQDSGGNSGSDTGGNRDTNNSTNNNTEGEDRNQDTVNTEEDNEKKKKDEKNNTDLSGEKKKKKIKSKQDKNTISIIFTGDMHSHLDGIKGTGGFPRLESRFDKIKEDYPESIILDAGDFSMGTAFQTIYRTEASELKMMGELGYDAAALGNHDLDYGPAGTAQMLNTAAKSKEIEGIRKKETDEKTNKTEYVTVYDQYMPALTCANIDWKSTLADKKLAGPAKTLKRAMNKYGVSDYTVIKKNGVRIAVFGIMGYDAGANKTMGSLKWKDPIETAKSVVAEINQNDEADMIVCLSHSGYTEEDGGSSEDAKLAKDVEGIDVIISGHEHTALKEPVVEDGTFIVSAGEYTEHVGNLVLKKQRGRYELKKYKLYTQKENIKRDMDIQSQVNRYKDIINEKYFSKYDTTYGDELADNEGNFPSLTKFQEDREDNGLGNIVADAYLAADKTADIAIVPVSAIHGSFGKGEITSSEVFTICSMGIGHDGKAGDPLISAYITGKELKRVAEINASLSKKYPQANLHIAGMKFAFNDRRLYLNRAVDMSVINNGKEEEIDNGKLYKIVTGLKTVGMLKTVEKNSRGLLSIRPKDKEGEEISDYKNFIIKKEGKEVKEWYALAGYLKSFKGDEIPEKYAAGDGRKVDKTSLAPWEIVKQPNNYGVMLAALIMIPIVILIGIILWLRKRRYQRRGYERTMFGSGKRQRRSIFKWRRMGISGGKRNRY